MKNKMIQNKIYELSYRGLPPKQDMLEINLRAEFYIDTKKTVVKGFYDGDGIYKIRFLPEQIGEYTWEVKGMFSDRGVATCVPGTDPGIVRAQGVEFVRDEKLFHPFGTTIYALAHQSEDLIGETLHSLKHSPFNKVRMCVFPKYYEWNRGEPPLHPFAIKNGKPDLTCPDLAFWRKLEKCIKSLQKLDIQCDLILFHPYDKWGYADMDREECFRYLDYVLRRLAAFPNIWWSIANEYDIMTSYLDYFYDFAVYIGENDPYHHLLSNHQMLSPWDFSEPHTTHVCTQTKDIDRTLYHMRRYGKPVVYDEVCYEGNIPYDWGNLTPQAMVDRFWRICCRGGYCTHGETYITENNQEDEILWWSKGGVLQGESPERIAFLRKLIESFPGKIMPIVTPFDVEPGWTADSVREMAKKGTLPAPADPIFQILTDEGFETVKRLREPNFGHIDDKIYLFYFSEQAPIVETIELPVQNCYDIQIIDAWNMTITPYKQGFSGKISVKLPAKPYIAILAKQESGEKI